MRRALMLCFLALMCVPAYAADTPWPDEPDAVIAADLGRVDHYDVGGLDLGFAFVPAELLEDDGGALEELWHVDTSIGLAHPVAPEPERRWWSRRP